MLEMYKKKHIEELAQNSYGSLQGNESSLNVAIDQAGSKGQQQGLKARRKSKRATKKKTVNKTTEPNDEIGQGGICQKRQEKTDRKSCSKIKTAYGGIGVSILFGLCLFEKFSPSNDQGPIYSQSYNEVGTDDLTNYSENVSILIKLKLALLYVSLTFKFYQDQIDLKDQQSNFTNSDNNPQGYQFVKEHGGLDKKEACPCNAESQEEKVEHDFDQTFSNFDHGVVCC